MHRLEHLPMVNMSHRNYFRGAKQGDGKTRTNVDFSTKSSIVDNRQRPLWLG